MKKSLIAAALVAASTAASAQSQVTLFGTADVGLARLSASSGSVIGVSTGGANISRWGLRGTEDLGGGLKAGFWLEAGMDVDTGAGKTAGAMSFNRRATASLMGTWGEIRLGRDDSATFLNTLIFDPFLTNGVGGTMAFVMRTGAPIIQLNNTIAYFLPENLGGFYGQLQHARGEVVGSPQGNYTGFRAGYRGGAWHASVSAGKQNGATSATDISIRNIGLSYDMGVAKPMLLIAEEETGGTTVRAIQLGVTAPMGQGQFRASVAKYDTSSSNADWTKLGIGYGYDFSKRTQLYGSLGLVRNSAGASKAIGVQGLTAPGNSLGSSSNGIEFGVRHFF